MREILKAGLLTLLLVTVSAVTLSACNTVHGAGEDIEKSSDAVKKAL